MKKLNEIESYILGFFQSDGHFDGRYLTTEISIKDSDILLKIHNLIKKSSIYYRKRDTNFKDNYESISLHIRDLDLINKLQPFLPLGKKSTLVSAPKNIQFSEIDYWRGLIDGDGSLGIKEIDNIPFISLNTSSDQLYLDFKRFIKSHIGFDLKISRNKRDNTYNIVLLMLNCFSITSFLYKNCSISMDRKQELANQIMKYDYLSYNSITNKNPFTKEEDLIILNNYQKDSLKLLSGHHPISISNRRRHLKKLRVFGLI